MDGCGSTKRIKRNRGASADVVYNGTFETGETPSNHVYVPVNPGTNPDNEEHKFLASQVLSLSEKCRKLEHENNALRAMAEGEVTEKHIEYEETISEQQAEIEYYRTKAKGLERLVDEHARAAK